MTDRPPGWVFWCLAFLTPAIVGLVVFGAIHRSPLRRIGQWLRLISVLVSAVISALLGRIAAGAVLDWLYPEPYGQTAGAAFGVLIFGGIMFFGCIIVGAVVGAAPWVDDL